jgi:two-component system, chemotaxis family, CheB/CheR fusion protein
LQSTNEELNTVNEELHGRNEELARINSDLVNFLNGVQIAIVIVAGDLRIRRFTPMAERILNLIPGDIGRPISQIKPNINVPDLEGLIGEVIDTVTVQHRDVQDEKGRMFSLTVRPYKNIDNRIDGAVLALFDVDELRRHEREAHEAREFAEWVLTAAPVPLVVLDPELKVRSVNPAFCEKFLMDKADAEGRSFLELSGGVWDQPELRTRLDQILPGDRLDSFEFEQTFPGLGRKQVSLQGWRTRGSDSRPASILLTIKDR